MIKFYSKLRLGKVASHIQRQINRILVNMGNGIKKRDSCPGQIG
jgi:hypothetical protein